MYRNYLSETKRFFSDNGERFMDSQMNKDDDAKSSMAQSQKHTIPRQGRKLILHFDARNTIFVADLFSRITVEMALNTYISGVVWGTAESNGSWRCISESVSLRPPAKSGVTSLYKLFERDIVRTPADRQRLRETLGNFTEQERGRKFRPVFEANLAKLRWPHDAVDSKLTVTGKDGSAYHYLLPSFLNLVEALADSGRPFCVLIRTFGRDAPHILNALNLLLQGRHPSFARKIDMPINMRPETFDRVSKDKFTYIKSDDTSLSTDRDVYDHWNSCEGIMAVVDDFEFWQANQYHFTAAKILWYDPEDSRHQHVIFDDNIRFYDDDSIVNVKKLDGPGGSPHAADCSADDFERLEDAMLVTANLIESISDANYFIDKVLQCERKYGDLMQLT